MAQAITIYLTTHESLSKNNQKASSLSTSRQKKEDKGVFFTFSVTVPAKYVSGYSCDSLMSTRLNAILTRLCIRYKWAYKQLCSTQRYIKHSTIISNQFYCT